MSWNRAPLPRGACRELRARRSVKDTALGRRRCRALPCGCRGEPAPLGSIAGAANWGIAESIATLHGGHWRVLGARPSVGRIGGVFPAEAPGRMKQVGGGFGTSELGEPTGVRRARPTPSWPDTRCPALNRHTCSGSTHSRLACRIFRCPHQDLHREYCTARGVLRATGFPVAASPLQPLRISGHVALAPWPVTSGSRSTELWALLSLCVGVRLARAGGTGSLYVGKQVGGRGRGEAGECAKLGKVQRRAVPPPGGRDGAGSGRSSAPWSGPPCGQPETAW